MPLDVRALAIVLPRIDRDRSPGTNPYRHYQERARSSPVPTRAVKSGAERQTTKNHEGNYMQHDNIGFPESQLLANGLPLEAAKAVSDAFWTGKDMKTLLIDTETTPAINSIIERLENHSARGKHE